uniref:Uncharacterized protein n=1 Tax=Magallana gigas TaxID=29159 RepID=K1QXT7_MAGGI
MLARGTRQCERKPTYPGKNPRIEDGDHGDRTRVAVGLLLEKPDRLSLSDLPPSTEEDPSEEEPVNPALSDNKLDRELDESRFPIAHLLLRFCHEPVSIMFESLIVESIKRDPPIISSPVPKGSEVYGPIDWPLYGPKSPVRELLSKLRKARDPESILSPNVPDIEDQDLDL